MTAKETGHNGTVKALPQALNSRPKWRQCIV